MSVKQSASSEPNFTQKYKKTRDFCASAAKISCQTLFLSVTEMLDSVYKYVLGGVDPFARVE